MRCRGRHCLGNPTFSENFASKAKDSTHSTCRAMWNGAGYGSYRQSSDPFWRYILPIRIDNGNKDSASGPKGRNFSNITAPLLSIDQLLQLSTPPIFVHTQLAPQEQYRRSPCSESDTGIPCERLQIDN